MLERIIIFYKRDLSSFNLVFKDIMWAWRLFISVSIVSAVGTILTVINNWPKIIIFFLIGSFLITFLIINSKAKKKLISEYGIASEGFLWGGAAYQEKRLELLNKYLSDNSIDKEKIKLLIELLYKRSEKNQPAGLVGAGLLLATFIPLWTQFLSWLFKGLGTFEEALYLFVSIIVLLLMIIVNLRMIQMMVIDILYREHETLKNLARMLEELLLTL